MKNRHTNTNLFLLFFACACQLEKKHWGRQRQNKAFALNRIQTLLILIVFSNIRVVKPLNFSNSSRSCCNCFFSAVGLHTSLYDCSLSLGQLPSTDHQINWHSGPMLTTHMLFRFMLLSQTALQEKCLLAIVLEIFILISFGSTKFFLTQIKTHSYGPITIVGEALGAFLISFPKEFQKSFCRLGEQFLPWRT